jgi:hypothetical protein
MTTHVECIDRDGYVRVVHGEVTSGGHQLSIHLAGREDTSEAHRTYPIGYDSRCGWCYLGANHSEDAHQEGITS